MLSSLFITLIPYDSTLCMHYDSTLCMRVKRLFLRLYFSIQTLDKQSAEGENKSHKERIRVIREVVS